MHEYVTLVNRTSKPLEAVWGGKRYVLRPGDNPLPRKIAEAAKRQNPIMGTGGMADWDIEHLVGIKEFGDDCSPTEQSDAIERINPNILHADAIARGKKIEKHEGTARAYRTVNALKSEDGQISNPASGFAYNDITRDMP